MVAHGVEMTSSKFAVGGYYWRICCCPNGYWGCGEPGEAQADIAIFISSDRAWRNGKSVNVTVAQVSILDHAGMPSYTRTKVDDNQCLGLGWKEYISHEDLDEVKHLKDDCLTILCDLSVSFEVSPMMPFDLHGQLAEAIWNKERPDVKIEVGGETFAAHRWVLEARSPVFKADLSFAYKINDNTDKLLRVDDMDAQVFKILLQFIYTDSPPENCLLEEASKAERLLVAADRYKLEKLKRICEDALCRHISMGSVASALALAEQHRCPVLWEACMQFLSSPDNFQAFMSTDGFEHLKTGCPSALLELVMKKMTQRAGAIRPVSSC
jgi:speckle-type POZ protein